jgi:hypothetical protein
MGYVAATAGFFTLGAYLGRHLSGGWAFVGFIAAFVCLIAMNHTVRQSGTGTTGLLFAVGLLLGLAPAAAAESATARSGPGRFRCRRSTASARASEHRCDDKAAAEDATPAAMMACPR